MYNINLPKILQPTVTGDYPQLEMWINQMFSNIQQKFTSFT